MTKPANEVLRRYKQLCRRIRRLPLDLGTLSRLRILTKTEFSAPPNHLHAKSSHIREQLPFNNKKYNAFVGQLDDILIHERYDNIHRLLNSIYKSSRRVPSWLKLFNEINYTKLTKVWPQVHLIYEVTKDPEVLKKYEQRLQEEQEEDISMIRHFGLTHEGPSLKLVKTYAAETPDLKKVMHHVTQLYNMILSNQGLISRTKIHSLEVLYPTNRFALPMNPARRDIMLKDKIASVRSILQQHLPVEKTDLARLIDVAQGKNDLNPYFYRYMIKKHRMEKQELNKVVRQKLRPKQLIPNDNNIRKWFRGYAVKQFYLEDDGSYKMSWMKDFYEKEGTILDERYFVKEKQNQKISS